MTYEPTIYFQSELREELNDEYLPGAFLFRGIPWTYVETDESGTQALYVTENGTQMIVLLGV